MAPPVVLLTGETCGVGLLSSHSAGVGPDFSLVERASTGPTPFLFDARSK